MTGLAYLRGDDVHVDREQTSFLNRGEYRVDDGLAIPVGNRGHCVLHNVGALLVILLKAVRIQRRLVMIARPDVVDPSLALEQQLVDIGRRPTDVSI